MGFLGQGLQRPTRDSLGTLQFVGMDYISTAGAFSWTVPAYVDVIDIISVGGGGGTYGSYGPAASGAVAQRIGKAVTPGQVISGTVGAGGAGGPNQPGGDTSVDGMLAKGALGTTPQAATGGDVNLPGSYSPPSDVYSLNLTLIGPSISGDSRWNGSTSSFSANGRFPGGGAYDTPNGGGGGFVGGSGAVFFIMYRRAS